jgi:beta-N-acetylhexosaminidase
MGKKIVLLMCIFLLFTVAGCNKVISKEKADIRGEITKLSLSNNSKLINILVEGKIEEDTSYDKASVYVGEKTKIYNADTNKELTISDLKEGLTVEIVFTGPVRESYPVQADAKIVKIIK